MYHYVFIQAASPEADIVTDLEASCGRALARRTGDGVDYSAQLDRAALELQLTHDFDEDRGIPFDRYQSVLVVRDFDRDMERQLALARRVVRSLADTGRYWVLLVYELQQFLEAAAPAGASLSDIWPPAKATE
ncbi:hypothetical protein OG500_29000 [Kitasatospora sp. NBC_01250]|uniref:hypothetical protein n=1 Tax=Kitasatospora sp. NBC_01250 TaxID=2903571 RepID=UPI002E359D2E|nr:hypothetical protein [Kitasatospora sp. NBC_01250]